MNRTERILTLIDKLGAVSVRQLHEMLKLGTYRNTCRVISNLSPYLNEIRSREKIVYLNKEGREFIGSEKEIKKTMLLDHMLLANDVFIYYNCPVNWKREFVMEFTKTPAYTFGIQVKGLNMTEEKKKIVSDAVFSRNGYVYFIEIDNTRSMIDNKKKIKKYLELWPEIRRKFQNPKLCIFTKSEKRKKTFQEWIRNVPNEIYTFEQIK